MNFFMPTKVYNNWFVVWEHAEEMSSLGTKALLVTGRHSAEVCGALDDVVDALTKFHTDYCVFSEVEENPSMETVIKARDYGLQEGADFVIGIGGGSPLDAAKAIALMLANPQESASFLYDKEAASHFNAAVMQPVSDKTRIGVLPVVAIPTTCGTGSEVTGVSVLTIHAKKTKGSIPFKIFPVLSLVDPKYLAFASDTLICNTAVDALAHLFESYLNTNATDYSRMCVDAGLQVWAKSREALLGLAKNSEDGQDSELTVPDLDHLMRASTFAGMAIAHTGTAIPHALSYEVTYGLGIPHGKACGLFLPGYLVEACAEDWAYLLSAAGFVDEQGHPSLRSLQTFLDTVCGETTLPRDFLEADVAHLLQNEAKLALAPFPMNEQVLNRIAGLT